MIRPQLKNIRDLECGGEPLARHRFRTAVDRQHPKKLPNSATNNTARAKAVSRPAVAALPTALQIHDSKDD